MGGGKREFFISSGNAKAKTDVTNDKLGMKVRGGVKGISTSILSTKFSGLSRSVTARPCKRQVTEEAY